METVSKPRKRIVPPAVLAILDTLCIAGAYTLALDRSVDLTEDLLPAIWSNMPYLLVVILVWYGAAIERGLWSVRNRQDVVHYFTTVTKAVGDACVFCVLVMVLRTKSGGPENATGGLSAESNILDHKFLVLFCLFTLVFILLFRFGLRSAIHEFRRLGYNKQRTVLIGANERARRLVDALRSNTGLGYELMGELDNDPERASVLEGSGVPYLGSVDTLKDLVTKEEVDEVYISLPVRSGYSDIQNIAQFCEDASVPVHMVADLFPMRVATSRLMHLEDIPLLNLSTIPEAHGKVFMKRAVDFLGSSMLILMLSPLLLLLAILVKLDSTGPIFFFQERVGQNQRRFRMIKYRSMVTNAEALKASLMAMNEQDGPVFKITNDPRITRLGRFIRKYSLDEFPQLFNVWKGEMSLVGPRPPIPSEVEQYTWSQRRRLSVRPGMTGLWQVSGRNNIGFEEWVELDLNYIDNWSIWLDFKILLMTFRAVVKGRGAS